MELDFQFFGAREMDQLFDALPGKMQASVIATAVRGGASIIRKNAKANLVAKGSIRTGLLHESINVRVKNYRADGIVFAAVGARRDVVGTTPEGKRIRPANYAHLVEFGTVTTRAKPFLRPALDSSRAAVFSKMSERARVGLAREIAKLRKATAK